MIFPRLEGCQWAGSASPQLAPSKDFSKNIPLHIHKMETSEDKTMDFETLMKIISEQRNREETPDASSTVDSEIGSEKCETCGTVSKSPKSELRSPRRTRHKREHIDEMEKCFLKTQRPTAEELEELERKLGISQMKIRIWFKNRRAKRKNLPKPKYVQPIPSRRSTTAPPSKLEQILCRLPNYARIIGNSSSNDDFQTQKLDELDKT